MGLFDDLADAGIDWSDIPTDPFSIKDGTYQAAVESITQESIKTKDGERPCFKFRYLIQGGPENGKSKDELKFIPTKEQAREDKVAAEQTLGYLFQRFASLGIEEPEGGYFQLEIDDLVGMKGTKVSITLVTKGEYQNVRTVKLYEEDSLAGLLGE